MENAGRSEHFLGRSEMKRVLISLLAVAALAGSALAQAPVPVTPQSVVSKNFFNAIFAPATSPCFTDLGQTLHMLIYNGAAGDVDIRLEASFNSDAATCTTGTWFPISDEGGNPPASGSNTVLGIGAYPFVRANLVTCGSCSAGVATLTASYTGTSALSGSPFGSYSSAQPIRKILFIDVSTDSNQATSAFYTPYGSMAGLIVVQPTGAFPASATLLIDCQDTGVSGAFSQTLPTGAPVALTFSTPATPCINAKVRYTQGGSTAQTFTAFYYFFPPGSALPAPAQPAVPVNKEVTAVNATASVTLTLTSVSLQRGHVFSVSARCSAGTAQLLVVDTTTSTNLWTSAPGEVGTTTFKYQWNPGLAGAARDTIQVQLTTCGAANTGTLDVQGSVF
jgi:hypothetical protein